MYYIDKYENVHVIPCELIPEHPPVIGDGLNEIYALPCISSGSSSSLITQSNLYAYAKAYHLISVNNPNSTQHQETIIELRRMGFSIIDNCDNCDKIYDTVYRYYNPMYLSCYIGGNYTQFTLNKTVVIYKSFIEDCRYYSLKGDYAKYCQLQDENIAKLIKEGFVSIPAFKKGG